MDYVQVVKINKICTRGSSNLEFLFFANVYRDIIVIMSWITKEYLK